MIQWNESWCSVSTDVHLDLLHAHCLNRTCSSGLCSILPCAVSLQANMECFFVFPHRFFAGGAVPKQHLF